MISITVPDTSGSRSVALPKAYWFDGTNRHKYIMAELHQYGLWKRLVYLAPDIARSATFWTPDMPVMSIGCWAGRPDNIRIESSRKWATVHKVPWDGKFSIANSFKSRRPWPFTWSPLLTGVLSKTIPCHLSPRCMRGCSAKSAFRPSRNQSEARC
jgi:hypothetical protein